MDADLILDDLVDSGATMHHYAQNWPEVPFDSLFTKPADDHRWYVFPWERQHPSQEDDSVQQNIIRSLQYIGEDPEREGLQDTPNRVVRSWDEIFAGYQQDPADILTTFDSDGYDQIVLLEDIELYSMCEHHMLPFYGRAHVAYIPDGRVVGISKLARLVDIYARRLQIQERIGEEVTSALMEHLQPKAAACIIEAQHLCMLMRGCTKQNTVMKTSSLRGAFLDDGRAREELMDLLK
jgi:GTP cyclohydrolase I